MDFSFNSDQEALKDLVRQAAKDLITPTLEEDDRQGIFRKDVIKKLGRLGLTGIATPEEYGGSGLGYVETVTALETLAYETGVSYPIALGVTGLPQVILHHFGTESQKKEILPKLASGEFLGAFSLSESGAGSDPGSISTKAIQDSQGHYIINGVKHWSTQADEADAVILFARTGGEAQGLTGSKGLSAFLVCPPTKGYSLGKIEKKMGAHISHTCEIILENLSLPPSSLVGFLHQGFKIAMTALDCGRINIGAMGVGLARAAFDKTVEYLQIRKQFSKPLLEFQGIQFQIADLHAAIEGAQALVYRAAWLRDQRLPHTREAAVAKLVATDTAFRVTSECVQLLGGAGYTQDYPLERWMREAKVLQIVEGTNQIQRWVIGRSFLS